MSSDRTKKPDSHDRMVMVPAVTMKPSDPNFRAQKVRADSSEFERPTGEHNAVTAIRAAVEAAIASCDIEKAMINNEALHRRTQDSMDLSSIPGYVRMITGRVEQLLREGDPIGHGKVLKIIVIHGKGVDFEPAFNKAEKYCRNRGQTILAKTIYRMRADYQQPRK